MYRVPNTRLADLFADPWASVWYVNNSTTYAHLNAQYGASDANRGNRGRSPLATLQQAVTNANAGDIIIVGPGHIESISANGALTIDKAGLRIVGLGVGDARPALLLDTLVAAEILCTAANVLLENLQVVCALDAVSQMMSVTGGGCTIRNCTFGATTPATIQPVIGVLVNGVRCTVEGCDWYFPVTGCAEALRFQAGADQLVVQFCKADGFFTTGGVVNDTAAADDVLIKDNYIRSMNTTAKPGILMKAAATGSIGNNKIRLGQDTATGAITGGACDLFENYLVNDDGEAGILIGTPSA
jgi:hypothetical protein